MLLFNMCEGPKKFDTIFLYIFLPLLILQGECVVCWLLAGGHTKTELRLGGWRSRWRVRRGGLSSPSLSPEPLVGAVCVTIVTLVNTVS